MCQVTGSDSQITLHRTHAAEISMKLQLAIRASSRQGGKSEVPSKSHHFSHFSPDSAFFHKLLEMSCMRSRPLLDFEEAKVREHMKEAIRSDWMTSVHSAVKKAAMRMESVVKPQDVHSSEADSGATGGLVHGKLSMEGSSRKGTLKAQRNQL